MDDPVRRDMELDKMALETEKLRAEIRKVWRETAWLPFIAGATITAGTTGLAALILHAFSR